MPRAKSQESATEEMVAAQPDYSTETQSAMQPGDEMNEQEVQERIARRAYEIYERRMAEGTDGDEMSDWLRAEAEVREQAGASDMSEATGRNQALDEGRREATS